MTLLAQDFELCLFCLYVFLLPFSFCDNLQSIEPALVFVLRDETSQQIHKICRRLMTVFCNLKKNDFARARIGRA